MPTVNGRRRPDLHHAGEVGAAMTDAEIGGQVGECLRSLAGAGHVPGDSMIALEMRFA
jgi:hypothetical protein